MWFNRDYVGAMNQITILGRTLKGEDLGMYKRGKETTETEKFWSLDQKVGVDSGSVQPIEIKCPRENINENLRKGRTVIVKGKKTKNNEDVDDDIKIITKEEAQERIKNQEIKEININKKYQKKMKSEKNLSTLVGRVVKLQV